MSPKSAGPKTKTKEEVPVAGLPTRRSEGFVTVYANNANLSAALYDLSIIFSEIITAGQSPVVEEKCRVVMNPWHAKALATVLTDNVKKWESQFGTINLPPGIVPGFDANKPAPP